MPMRVGLLLYPLFIIAVASKRSGVVSKFRKVGAWDEATARRPQSLGVGDARLVQDEVRRGVLVAVGDGRYYLDRAALRRVRNRLIGIAIIVGGLLTVGGLLLYQSLRH